jgi:hypothetical protein
MTEMLRSIGSAGGSAPRPPLPKLLPSPADASFVVLVDYAGWRWRVSDVRDQEQPKRIRRRPPDPEATHRIFKSEHGVMAWIQLDALEEPFRYHGVERDSLTGYAMALGYALDRTPGARSAYAVACERAYLARR